MTNYCIAGYGIPMWSPNGNYIMINTSADENDENVFLIDLKRNMAVKIAESAKAYGWMVKEP